MPFRPGYLYVRQHVRDMQVSFFEPTDLDALAVAFQDMGQHYFGSATPDNDSVRRALVEDVLGSDSGVRIVVARDGPEVAGFATVSILYPAPGFKGQLFMKDLYVCSAWRGRGIGELVMRFLAGYALRKGCVRLDWTTENTNSGAIAFYERLGASKVQEKVYFRLTVPEMQALAARPQEGSAA
jgi:ribosomal protein S18 acetylase RimI-like enzyme